MLPACEICGELGHDAVSCSRHSGGVDYDEAGRQLLESLHAPSEPAVCTRRRDCTCRECNRSLGLLGEALLPLVTSKHGPLNQIWSPKEGTRGASSGVWVGGIAAAQNLERLKHCGITHVVQCMNRQSLNVHAGICYHDFPIESWRTKMPKRLWPHRLTRPAEGSVATADEIELAAAVGALFAPVMRFVRQAVEGGGGVLIHCFAGAHRAGTTGVAWLMHADGLSTADAIATAQRLRPVIDPEAYSDLHGLLQLFEAFLMRQHAHESLHAAEQTLGRSTE